MAVRYVSGEPCGAAVLHALLCRNTPESLIPQPAAPGRPPRCPDVLALFSILGTQGRLQVKEERQAAAKEIRSLSPL